MSVLERKIELGWLVPNKMLYLISLWETFDVQATAIHEIYLRRSVLLEQQKKGKGGSSRLLQVVHRNGSVQFGF